MADGERTAQDAASREDACAREVEESLRRHGCVLLAVPRLVGTGEAGTALLVSEVAIRACR